MDHTFISAFVLLLLVLDPFGSLPIFISVLRSVSPERRAVVAIREVSIAFSVLLILAAEIIQSNTSVKPESYVQEAEKNLRRLEQKMSRSLDDIADITTDSSFHNYFIHQGFQEIGFSFFYVENETITKWSDNETDISSKMADTSKYVGHYKVFIRV